MSEQLKQDEVLAHSFASTEAGRDELYMYSLRKMADENVQKDVNLITNLPTLRAFFYTADEAMMRYQEMEFALVVLDIAQFKAVNEFCGRSAGDYVLKQIALALTQVTEERPMSYACHMRADIFVLLTPYLGQDDIVSVVNGLKSAIDNINVDCKLLPAFGICTTINNGRATSYLKDCATRALNTIKGKFYASYAFFDEEMRTRQLMNKKIENEIVPALKNGELKLFVQPKVDMTNGKIVGGEALVRWVRPDKTMVSPGEFIPVLETDGFIINVDYYMWEQVFAFIADMLENRQQPVPISINVSRVHAYDTDFMQVLKELSEKYDVPATYVPLELTESAFSDNENMMYDCMRELRKQGFKVSMDDYGTGYSNMRMLKNEPVDEIKVDRAFVNDIENQKGRVILKHTLGMLKELGANIIIEGVETEAQKDFLIECGCKKAQGFLFYKPMPVEEFKELILKSGR